MAYAGSVPSLREIRLFAHALRQGWRAQAIRRGVPLPALIDRLCAARGLPHRVDAGEGARATSRACSRLARYLGALDTCLIRSLVVGSLLADQEEVRLHIGLRREADDEDPLAGHAWVSLAGRPVLPETDTGEPFLEIHTVALERRR